MADRRSTTEKIRALKKDDSVLVKTNANVAGVLAHRVHGKGKCTVKAVKRFGNEYAEVTRTK